MSRFSVCFRHECVCVRLGVFVCLIVFVTNCCEPVCVLALRVVSESCTCVFESQLLQHGCITFVY